MSASTTSPAAVASTADASCGAPAQGLPLPPSVDLTKETVISGVVTVGDQPVSGAYVRLLDASGEFAAEVVTSAAGQFRFFAAPGRWTLRALSRAGTGDTQVTADRGITEVTLPLAAA
jgi:Protein of unknown function (DUF1416).